MTLKNATLLALIGTGLTAIAQLYFFLYDLFLHCQGRSGCGGVVFIAQPFYRLGNAGDFPVRVLQGSEVNYGVSRLLGADDLAG